MPTANLINSNVQGLLFACAVTLLTACQSTPPVLNSFPDDALKASDALFGSRPVMPEPRDIHLLTDEQQSSFLQYFHNPIRAAVPAYQRVADYLGTQIRSFSFRTDTYNATETLTSNSGNCLSLAILTTALAHLAGVETAYQLMDSEPVFEFHGTVVEKGVHVRTLLLNPERQESVLDFFASDGIAIDFFPTQRERFVRNMANEEYVAMYYRNIANEALRSNDLHISYWHARESLRYDSTSSDALNTLAIATRRAGYNKEAESIYLYAIEHARDKLTLLKNYRVLLTSTGRLEEATLIDRRLQNIADPSPFNWFQLARSAFEDGDYDRAVTYYQRALALAPYLHEAHLGMARSYAGLGHYDESVQSLVAAIDNAGRLRDRKYYKAKLGEFLH